VRQLQAPELHDILDWLTPRAARVKELPLTLLHGDYRLEHVIAEGTRVRAILGWERAVLGDPRLDVGYASAVLGAYGLTLSNQFLDAYLTAAGSLPASGSVRPKQPINSPLARPGRCLRRCASLP
jgi:aminoglycoside phosphotransferase (APT) family kinase protein